MDDSISVVEATNVDDELIAAMGSLVRQLSTSASAPTVEEVREIIESPCTTLLVARDCSTTGRIIGMLTLVVFRIPTGTRGWIEDVAVDVAARGKGVGEALSREALRVALAHGARTVELSSRPSREAANRLTNGSALYDVIRMSIDMWSNVNRLASLRRPRLQRRAVLRLIDAEFSATWQCKPCDRSPALLVDRRALHLLLLHLGDERLDVVAH